MRAACRLAASVLALVAGAALAADGAGLLPHPLPPDLAGVCVAMAAFAVVTLVVLGIVHEFERRELERWAGRRRSLEVGP